MDTLSEISCDRHDIETDTVEDAISLRIVGRRTNIETFYYLGAEKEPLKNVIFDALDEFDPHAIAKELVDEYAGTDHAPNPYNIVLDIIDAEAALRDVVSELQGKETSGMGKDHFDHAVTDIISAFYLMESLAAANRPDFDEYAYEFDRNYKEAMKKFRAGSESVSNIEAAIRV